MPSSEFSEKETYCPGLGYRLETYMQESETELELMWELPPTGWRRVGDARKMAIEQMAPAIGIIVESVWETQLLGSMVREAHRKVGIGVREAVAILTLRKEQAQMKDSWRSDWYLNEVPPYWEPAESSLQGHGLSEHWLQAYRWSAAIVNLHVRDQLENLHASHTSDESMPVLNRSIRNAVYHILLRDVGMGYHLGYWPGVLLKAKALGASGPIHPS